MFQTKSKVLILLCLLLVCAVLPGCDEDNPSVLQGKAGSMARFAMAKDHLYVVDKTSIHVYQLASDGTPAKTGTLEAGFGIETIFATDKNLFLGAENGMYVYGIEDPANPQFISAYSHILACDPVVVQGQYAYVTLRVSRCRTFGFDALEIIDIKNLANPIMVSSYATESPYGLGVDKTLLFLCQGDSGLKIFDITNPKSITEIKHYPSIHAYDVIPNNGVLLVTGNTGIFQYDYADAQDIRQLSHIPAAP